MAGQCPITECKGTVRRGMLMCAPHWRLVPEDLNRRVYQTWDAFQLHRDAGTLEAYRAARDEAIAAVHVALDAKEGKL